MQAVILIGGFGTRLKPLTETNPKHVLPIADRTMLEHIMSWLVRQSSGESQLIDQAVLSMGYKPEAINQRYPGGVCAQMPFECAIEPEPLGTAGGIAFGARQASISDAFLAMNGDILCDFSCAELLETHRRNQAKATIALTEVADPSRFGLVETEPSGQVAQFLEKPTEDNLAAAGNDGNGGWINAGIYILEPEVLELVPPAANVSIEREVFPQLAAGGSLYAVKCQGRWIDAGTPQAFLDAQFFKAGLAASAADSYLHAEAIVSDYATLNRSVVMAGAQVESGAAVEGSALLPGCIVHSGAAVKNSIIGPHATVGTAAVVENLSVIAGNVEANTHLSAARC